jgi:excisionase family DNA binding protein
MLLTVKDVCAKLKVTKSTVYKMLREDPSFPRSITIGPRVVRWKEADLTAWIDDHG